jgi:hypothetical protein
VIDTLAYINFTTLAPLGSFGSVRRVTTTLDESNLFYALIKMNHIFQDNKVKVEVDNNHKHAFIKFAKRTNEALSPTRWQYQPQV